MLTQTAPWPTELEWLVDHCSYRAHEGWRVRLYADLERDSDAHGNWVGHGTTLAIYTRGYDAYHPENGIGYGVVHYFIVPAATYNRDAWNEWLFFRFRDVETHEAGENYIIDGERPFAPTHGPGENPYVVHSYRDEIAARTRPNGDVVAKKE